MDLITKLQKNLKQQKANYYIVNTPVDLQTNNNIIKKIIVSFFCIEN